MLIFFAVLCFAVCLLCLIWAGLNFMFGGSGGNETARIAEKQMWKSLFWAAISGTVGIILLLLL